MLKNKIFKINKFFIFTVSVIVFSLSFFTLAAKHNLFASTNSLSGKILLQVEENGEAWYVNPLNNLRYYLGRPSDAFNLMRSLGLGVSNKDINYFKVNKAPERLLGRILIQAEDKGQAFYVNPVNLELIYLGRPADAFSLMRNLGLGITNSDLNKINTIETSYNIENKDNYNADKRYYSFIYNNLDYVLNLNLNTDLYLYYSNQDKTLSYYKDNPPLDLRDSFYNIFLQTNSSDTAISDLIVKAKEISQDLNLNDDQFAEFIISLVQYIPYDFSKISTSLVNTSPYYPYESLYLNKGVCSDKAFLGLQILRELGYGSAILDFPEANHSALGISCPNKYSVNNSGYCFIETTNYFPFAVVPKTITEGQAESLNISDFSNIFSADHFGEMNIFQAREGKVYYDAEKNLKKANDLLSIDLSLDDKNKEIDITLDNLNELQEQVADFKEILEQYIDEDKIAQYNKEIPDYNIMVNNYNALRDSYELQIDNYNKLIEDYNLKMKEFYQK